MVANALLKPRKVAFFFFFFLFFDSVGNKIDKHQRSRMHLF